MISVPGSARLLVGYSIENVSGLIRCQGGLLHRNKDLPALTLAMNRSSIADDAVAPGLGEIPLLRYNPIVISLSLSTELIHSINRWGLTKMWLCCIVSSRHCWHLSTPFSYECSFTMVILMLAYTRLSWPTCTYTRTSPILGAKLPQTFAAGSDI